MPVLDTTFLIDVEADRGRAREVLRDLSEGNEPLWVPAQAAMEYLAGLDNTLQGWHWINESFTVVLPEPKHVLEGARLASLASHKGRRPRWADIQIAAVAMLEATYVVTANARDYLGLDVPAWDYRHDDRPRPGP